MGQIGSATNYVSDLMVWPHLTHKINGLDGGVVMYDEEAEEFIITFRIHLLLLLFTADVPFVAALHSILSPK